MSWKEVTPMTLTVFDGKDRQWKNEEREHTELTLFRNQMLAIVDRIIRTNGGDGGGGGGGGGTIEHSFWESHYEPGLFHTNINRQDYFVLNDERTKTKFMFEFIWRYNSCHKLKKRPRLVASTITHTQTRFVFATLRYTIVVFSFQSYVSFIL
jgi:hypothetical protein